MLWNPLHAVRLIRGRHHHFVESKNSNRIAQRPKLYTLEADPIIGPGWRKEGKRTPRVIVVRKEFQLVGEKEVRYEVL